jgi:hypothetical protein
MRTTKKLRQEIAGFPPWFQHVLWKTWKTRNFAGFSAFPSNSDSKGDQQCQLEWRALAMTVRIIAILAVAIVIGPSLSHGSPACLTETEARAKFPKAHLIWLGTNHCWTFGVVPVHSRRPVLAAESVPSPRPVLAAESVPWPRPVPAAEPASSPPPALAAAPVPSPRPEPEIVNSDIDAGAQCRYSPCE